MDVKSEESAVRQEVSPEIEELQSIELLPLVLDIVEEVHSGKLLPKDVDNAVSRWPRWPRWPG